VDPNAEHERLRDDEYARASLAAEEECACKADLVVVYVQAECRRERK
jgi:hypothetical protein